MGVFRKDEYRLVGLKTCHGIRGVLSLMYAGAQEAARLVPKDCGSSMPSVKKAINPQGRR